MTAPMTMTNCPTDPEVLAAFADGRLEGEERQRVIEHITTCAECRSTVLTATEWNEVAAVLPPAHKRSHWIPVAALMAAAAILAMVLFLTPLGERLGNARRMRALAAELNDIKERPLQARLTLDKTYKRHDTFRGGDGESADYGVMAAALRIAAAADRNPSASNLHAAGVAYLVLENTKQENYKQRGVELLERALLMEMPQADVDQAIRVSKDVILLNDLAAGYDAIGDEKHAVAAITRAWTLKRSPVVAWTRAVILRTNAAWQDYLSLDSTSGWSDEARDHMKDATP